MAKDLLVSRIHGSAMKDAETSLHNDLAGFDTVVMGIHQDEKQLPYSLKPLLSFPGEIILVLDDPSPRSFQIADKFRRLRPNVHILWKDPSQCSGISNRVWQTFLCGSTHAKGERMFWIGSDLIMPELFWQRELVLPCKFQYIDAETHFGWAWHKFLSNFSKHYCNEVFPRGFEFFDYAWNSEETVAKTDRPELRFHLYDEPTALHLRKTRNPARQYVQGIQRCRQGTPFWKVLSHALLFWKPFVLTGYLHAILS